MQSLVPFTVGFLASQEDVERVLLGIPACVTEETARSKLVPQFKVVPHAHCPRVFKALL